MKTNVNLKRVFSFLMALAMVLTLVPQPAHATEESGEPEAVPATAAVTVTDSVAVEADPSENDELFALYAEAKLYGYEMATFGTAGRDSLNAIEQSIYDALKIQIEDVAANGGSTAFAVTGISGLKTVWTNEEVSFSDTDTTQVKEAFKAQFSSGAIMNALLRDCPYDLYWFDKTETGGTSTSYSVDLSGQELNGVVTWTEAVITDLTFTFRVSEDYKSAENTVTSDVSRVTTARNNALAVVSANASKSPYEKLLAYKNYICEATAYNHAAADDDSTPYGDPWQLISVFDGDPDTTVVCEGYSKAFQYLCDLGGLDCISASGTMSGGTGSGRHMWNVVTLESENYLVDVTNCDEGTIGAPDKLFLVGAPYENGGYTISGVTFGCDDLGLAEENYTLPGEEETTAQITGMSLTVDGIPYTEGEIILTAESKVIMTLTGTNFANLSDNNVVWPDADGYHQDPVSADYGWVIDADANTATLDFEYSYGVENTFRKNNGFELQYSNDGKATWIGSGIYLTYDDGTLNREPAQITGLSITIDGVVYDSTNTSATNPAVITPDSTVTITAHGTNLFADKVTQDHYVKICYVSGDFLNSGWWAFSDDGSTASSAAESIDFSSTVSACELKYGNQGGAAEKLVGSGVYIVYDDGSSKPETLTYYFDVTGYATPVNAYLYGPDNSIISFTHPVTHVEGNIYSIDVTAEVGLVHLCDAEDNIIGDRGISLATDGSNLFTYSTDLWSVYGEEPEVETITIYFDNTEGWTTVNVYFWSDSNHGMTTWPGDAMTHMESSIWSVEIPAEAQMIIFNNGSSQTADITIPTDGKNLYTYSTDLWSVYGEEPIEPEEPETLTYYFDVTGYAAPAVAYTYNADGSVISFSHPVTQVEGNIYSIEVTADVGIVQLCDAEDNIIGGMGIDLPTDGSNLYTYSTGLWSVYGEEPEAEPITVYFENTEGWTTVNAYYWIGNTGMTTWPGDAMTHLADNIWFIKIPAEAQYIIFNNGAGSQTADLTIPTDGSNCYTYGTGTWSTYVEESYEITINMADYYGDGWNGNAIEVFENGELIATVTFDEGSTGTWTGTYYPAREYEFLWVVGSYSYECSFEIIIDEETVFSATTEDCGAFPDGYRVFPVCEHDYGEGVVTAPGCESAGYTTYTCSLCGLSYEDDFVDSLGGHTKDEEIEGIVTAPTCVDQGYTTYTCTVCNESYDTDYVDPLGHSKAEDDEGIVTDPTCDEEGYTTYTCTVCGESYDTDYVEELGHSKGDQEGIVTAPTCYDQGYTTYTCTVCGESYSADYVDPLGHTLGEDGNCSVCGELYTVPVWVAGYQIDAVNLNDILSDGTVSFDPATKTLTLNGYQGGRIDAEIPLNILLLGENSIESSEYGLAFNIYSGEISISGTGSLDIYSAYEGIYVYGGNMTLTVGGSVTVNLMAASEGINLYADATAALVIKDGATVIAGTESTPLEEECVYVYGESSGSVTITGSASFSCATNDEEGIYVGSAGTESLTISGSATVYANANEEGLDADTITISGGTVTAIGGVDYEGIYADDLIISGGTVTAMGDGQGIEADNITITGGTVNVTGGGMIATAYNVEGELVHGTITLGQDMAITAPEDAVLGELDLTAEEEGPVMTILNPDGTMADTFTISAANAPIVITQQPVNCEGVIGDSAVFTVVAEGEGLTYQWYYFDTDTNDWQKSHSPGSSTGTVSPVFYGYRDGQQYRCVITDAEGNSVISEAVTMTLKSGEATITTQPADVSGGAINRTYTFTVAATGDNLTYLWQVSTDGGETWNQTWLDGYNTDTLTVKLNANRSGNLYRCVITSAGKDSVTSEAACLNLQEESVQILEQPVNVKARPGETAEFVVDADGMDLTFTWYRYENGSLTKLEGHDTAVLNLEAGVETMGKYLCRITDGSGKTLSTSVVTLGLYAQILTQPESVICAAGETASFTVEARGENLKYRWYYSTDGGETWTETWLTGYNTVTLSFLVIASRAEKIYKCVITDRYGNTLETNFVSVTIG